MSCVCTKNAEEAKIQEPPRLTHSLSLFPFIYGYKQSPRSWQGPPRRLPLRSLAISCRGDAAARGAGGAARPHASTRTSTPAFFSLESHLSYSRFKEPLANGLRVKVRERHAPVQFSSVHISQKTRQANQACLTRRKPGKRGRSPHSTHPYPTPCKPLTTVPHTCEHTR